MRYSYKRKKLICKGGIEMSALTRDVNIGFVLRAESIKCLNKKQTKEQINQSKKSAKAFERLIVTQTKK